MSCEASAKLHDCLQTWWHQRRSQGLPSPNRKTKMRKKILRKLEENERKYQKMRKVQGKIFFCTPGSVWLARVLFDISKDTCTLYLFYSYLVYQCPVSVKTECFLVSHSVLLPWFKLRHVKNPKVFSIFFSIIWWNILNSRKNRTRTYLRINVGDLTCASP